MARRGAAWRAEATPGGARRGLTRLGAAGVARCGQVRHGTAGLGEAGLGKARLGAARTDVEEGHPETLGCPSCRSGERTQDYGDGSYVSPSCQYAASRQLRSPHALCICPP
jgi:hypothetical protein